MRAVRWLALALCAAFGVTGCSPTQAYVNARKVETVASTAVMDGYAAWREADYAYQEHVVSTSPNLDAAKTELARWRTVDQAQVDKAFASARDAIYALDQALAADTATKQADFGAALGHVIGAVTALAGILTRYGVNLKPLGVGL